MKYNGDLKGFPTEIVEKMLERQVEQGNPKDVSVFEKVRSSTKPENGFNWHDTIEGIEFWCAVLLFKKIYVFFAKYPKQKDCSIVSQFNIQNKCKN